MCARSHAWTSGRAEDWRIGHSLSTTPMKSVAAISILLVLAGCGGVGAPSARAAHEQQVVVSPTDTATVRRLFTAPDSVLAMRSTCVLRCDYVGVRLFLE